MSVSHPEVVWQKVLLLMNLKQRSPQRSYTKKDGDLVEILGWKDRTTVDGEIKKVYDPKIVGV